MDNPIFSSTPTDDDDYDYDDHQRSSNDSNDGEEAEMIADDWLDEAIASKRSGNIENCSEANFQRMKACPRFKTTDAIRLLGMKRDQDAKIPSDDDNGEGGHTPIDEISNRGLFEIDDRRSPSGTFIPSREARVLGKQVKELFCCRGYRLKACQTFLIPHIEDYDSDSDTEKDRIFSAQSFLQHRHDVYWARRRENLDSMDGAQMMGELETLVWLFLFGLAIHHSKAVEILGLKAVDILLRANLLRKSPVEPDTMLVAEVQIYPLDIGVFLPNMRDTEEDIRGDESFSLFVTDWNIESLRQTHSAIMPVGYDTLELLAVTAGEMRRQQQLLSDNTKPQCETTKQAQNMPSEKRILDLCCGCGIQGIFAWRCYMKCVASFVKDASCGLVLSDINKRAMHFVTANLAINQVPFETYDTSKSHDESAYGLCGDLFESIINLQPSTFDFILCNPPFVAIPSPTDSASHLKTPLYGIGGGLDGMVCLRRILHKLYRHLCATNCQAMALMVTEVPNVEESPAMIASFLPKSDEATARIRIVYIQDDVETVEVYAKERELEAGIDTDVHTDTDHRSWLSSMIASGIYNRALVLISLGRTLDSEIDSERLGLFKYESSEEYQKEELTRNSSCSSNSDSIEVDPVDEQDMFLHHTGMDFARKALLFSPF
mmetsp:Transcript_15782/g.43659  ORF Transcript_15782/g.43659 Transcript_15782/m.43659 type:complete len:660 (-) Transcript_15782:1566-3545(-)|eukprot:CAMPEP_0172371716 /NCGR_PEP_ID=MMETSP1060-20121228/44527_1 /TAXON_ID=37318 /ORGANISM="Pseudo-nitzschia pungens, Strain cf. cingulata" /LENGTH=659 /DNA_ID=CAMNT_0013097441 /DNA_START=386 /DNA_END=2365 /DNA_ORIENTATION=+